LKQPIARYSGDIVQWCFHKISGEDNEWFNTTKRALVDKPRVFTERYPNLVWVIGYRAVHPKDEFKDWGAIETQDDRQIFKVTVNQFILQRLIPEKQIALVVEQMDDPSVQWQAASVDVAEGKLARFATKLGISLAVHNLVSLSSVYEVYPVHCFDVNPLVHILWQFGTIKASAFLSLLDSTEPDLFLHYPNLSLAKFLLDDYHICRALRRVVKHLIDSSPGGVIPDNLDPTFDERHLGKTIEGFEAQTYAVTAAIFNSSGLTPISLRISRLYLMRRSWKV
jgi:hypothetical protein